MTAHHSDFLSFFGGVSCGAPSHGKTLLAMMMMMMMMMR
jgi:hypothetical protein